MKKTLFFVIIFFCTISNISAENIKRIVIGNADAKISIIAFESLTCSHCANFHKDVFPDLKKDYLDTGLAKIEFRHFPLDIAAFNASKIAQCKKYLDNSEDKIIFLIYMDPKTIKFINKGIFFNKSIINTNIFIQAFCFLFDDLCKIASNLANM